MVDHIVGNASWSMLTRTDFFFLFIYSVVCSLRSRGGSQQYVLQCDPLISVETRVGGVLFPLCCVKLKYVYIKECWWLKPYECQPNRRHNGTQSNRTQHSHNNFIWWIIIMQLKCNAWMLLFAIRTPFVHNAFAQTFSTVSLHLCRQKRDVDVRRESLQPPQNQRQCERQWKWALKTWMRPTLTCSSCKMHHTPSTENSYNLM